MSGVDIASATEAGIEAGVPHRSLRILIVDDNKPFAETLSWVLEGAGHKIEISHSGPVALEIAKRFDPDVVFLDIHLPVMNGYDVCRRLREQSKNPGLKIIARSGYGDTALEADRRGVCFDAHLAKPLDVRQIVRLLGDIRRTRPDPAPRPD